MSQPNPKAEFMERYEDIKKEHPELDDEEIQDIIMEETYIEDWED
jgi:hypothetical protein